MYIKAHAKNLATTRVILKPGTLRFTDMRPTPMLRTTQNKKCADGLIMKKKTCTFHDTVCHLHCISLMVKSKVEVIYILQ